MRILFVSYWGISEGLSASTVIPHLEILASFENVEKIFFCSIERNNPAPEPSSPGEKIQHIPLISDAQKSVIRTKINDFKIFPAKLIQLCQEHRIDFILCRSSLAGALGYLVHRKLNIPYAVESFEPHGDYMLESGVWPMYDPRLWIQRYFERSIKRTARLLFPVSNHYRDRLLNEGIDQERIVVQPCCVSLAQFSFSKDHRDAIRSRHNIAADTITGVYAGKFGGIYYDKEAFDLYAEAFHFFGEKFFLIILSADEPASIHEHIRRAKLPTNRILFLKAPHHEVPMYLSAADFAFSTIKPAPSRIFCSPIKDGEYWANGLPVLIEDNIGDDSAIIQQEGGGVILDPGHPRQAFAALLEIMKRGRAQVADEIQSIAFKYRRLELIKASYEPLLHKIIQKF
jgi:hypothetical protein